jgi:hypothetical protein
MPLVRDCEVRAGRSFVAGMAGAAAGLPSRAADDVAGPHLWCRALAVAEESLYGQKVRSGIEGMKGATQTWPWQPRRWAWAGGRP